MRSYLTAGIVFAVVTTLVVVGCLLVPGTGLTTPSAGIAPSHPAPVAVDSLPAHTVSLAARHNPTRPVGTVGRAREGGAAVWARVRADARPGVAPAGAHAQMVPLRI